MNIYIYIDTCFIANIFWTAMLYCKFTIVITDFSINNYNLNFIIHYLNYIYQYHLKETKSDLIKTLTNKALQFVKNNLQINGLYKFISSKP